MRHCTGETPVSEEIPSEEMLPTGVAHVFWMGSFLIYLVSVRDAGEFTHFHVKHGGPFLMLIDLFFFPSWRVWTTYSLITKISPTSLHFWRGRNFPFRLEMLVPSVRAYRSLCGHGKWRLTAELTHEPFSCHRKMAGPKHGQFCRHHMWPKAQPAVSDTAGCSNWV